MRAGGWRWSVGAVALLLSSSSSSSSSSLGSRGGIVLPMMETSLHSAAEKFSGMRWAMVGSLLDVATFMRGCYGAGPELQPLVLRAAREHCAKRLVGVISLIGGSWGGPASFTLPHTS